VWPRWGTGHRAGTVSTPTDGARAYWVFGGGTSLALCPLAPPSFVAGGGFAFYSQNLAHNTGFWPKTLTCDVFPTITVSTTVSPSSCLVNTNSVDISAAVCATLNGTYTDAVTTSAVVPVTSCVGNNGFCCISYFPGAASIRTTIILILKTPYCIGFLIAVILNLLLPEDKKELERAMG